MIIVLLCIFWPSWQFLSSRQLLARRCRNFYYEVCRNNKYDHLYPARHIRHRLELTKLLHQHNYKWLNGDEYDQVQPCSKNICLWLYRDTPFPNKPLDDHAVSLRVHHPNSYHLNTLMKICHHKDSDNKLER